MLLTLPSLSTSKLKPLQLAASTAYPVAVRPGKYGKSLFATRAVKAGDPLLLERLPLVAAQTSRSAARALVCGRCFRFLGTPEGQLAHALLSSSASAAAHGHGGGGRVSSSAEPEGRDGAAASSPGPSQQQLGGFSSDELVRLVAGERGAEQEGEGGGSVLLPLPRPLPCPGGCSDELYCSPECAAADWGRGGAGGGGEDAEHGRRLPGSHALLCGGADPSSPLASAVDDLRELCSETNDSLWLACKALAGVVSESRRLRRREREREKGEAGGGEDDPPADRALLSAWLPWSVAEKALWWEQVSWPPTETTATTEEEDAGGHRHRHHHSHGGEEGGECGGDCGGVEEDEEEEQQTEAAFRASLRNLVRAAASGLSAVFAARAAAATAAPGPSSPHNEEEREEELAAARLSGDDRLLGCLLGCFELNNLEISVPPLLRTVFPPSVGEDEEEEGGSDDDDGEGGEGKAAAGGDDSELKNHPLLSRLVSLVGGPRAARSCSLFSVKGSAFYALQSCANHSCAPTARAVPGAFTRGLSPPSLASLSLSLSPRPRSSPFPEPPRGAVPCSALLVAAVDLEPGDEVTICYVDERGSKEERARALRDYGILECDCRRCRRGDGDGEQEEEEKGEKKPAAAAAAAAAAASSHPSGRRRTREGEGGEAEGERAVEVNKRARTRSGGEKKEGKGKEKQKETPSPPPSLPIPPSSSTATPWLGAWRAL